MDLPVRPLSRCLAVSLAGGWLLATAASAQAQACERTVNETSVRMLVAPEGAASFSVRIEADRARIDLLRDRIEAEGSIRATGTGAAALPWMFAGPYADPTGTVHVAAGQAPSLSVHEGQIVGSVRLGYQARVDGLVVPCGAITLEPPPRVRPPEPPPRERVDGSRWSPVGSSTPVFARPDPDASAVMLQARYPEDLALQRTDTRPGWFAVFYGSGRAYVAGWVRRVDLREYRDARRAMGGMAGGGRRDEGDPADYEGPLALPAGLRVYAERERGEWAQTTRPLEALVRWRVRDADADAVWVRVLELPGVQELQHSFTRDLEPSSRLAHAWVRVPLSSIPDGAAIRARVQASRPSSPGAAALAAARLERGIQDASSLTVGAGFGCALREGEVRCWGHNERGQLGDGTTFSRDHAQGVAGLGGVTSVIAAAGGVCALTSGGEVWCWGGPEPEQRRPARVEGLDGTIAISGGPRRVCALDAAGGVRCGSPATGLEPVDGVADAIAMAATSSHACALRATGGVVCWGDNRGGAVGVEGRATITRPVSVPDVTDAVGLWAGTDLTCARVRSGGLWCWGQVIAQRQRRRSAPAEVAALAGARQVAITGEAICTLGEDGPVRCQASGYGDRSVLTGESAYRGPAEIPETSGAQAVALGYRGAACLLDAEGAAWCWGRRTAHQPREVHGLTGAHTLRAGYGRSCAAFSQPDGGTDGLRCWPGTGLSPHVEAPVDFDIAAGGMCAVERSGTIRCTGLSERGWSGETGVSAVSMTTSITCVVVAGAVRCNVSEGQAADPSAVLGPVVDVSASRSRICSVEQSGRVVCWGVERDGESEPEPPTVVPGVADAVEVHMGMRHGCIRRRGGAISCFNEDGVLDLPGFREARSFDVQGSRVCVVDGQGHVHCLRFRGRSDTHRARYEAPVRVEGLNDATAVALGDADRTCALRETGQVMCWGDATGGLADGETGPVRVEER